jgi:PleD family two-component response regulator
VTVSIGIARVVEGSTAQDLISRADAAMYQVKREGGNRVLATDS